MKVVVGTQLWFYPNMTTTLEMTDDSIGRQMHLSFHLLTLNLNSLVA